MDARARHEVTRALAARHAMTRVLLVHVAGFAGVLVPLTVALSPRETVTAVVVATLAGAAYGGVHAVAQAVAIVHAERERWRVASVGTATGVALFLGAGLFWLHPYGALLYVVATPCAVARWVVPDDRSPERG